MSDTAYSPSASQDVVAIFDSNGNQLFPDARPMKASLAPKAKLMSHPVETGVTLTDYRVLEPREISLSMTLLPTEYADIYATIEQQYNAGTVVSVQLNTGLYQNFVLQEMPHDEAPEIFDTIKITLKLKEVFFFSAVSSIPVPTTKNGGNINGTKANTSQTAAATEKAQAADPGSVLYRAAGYN